MKNPATRVLRNAFVCLFVCLNPVGRNVFVEFLILFHSCYLLIFYIYILEYILFFFCIFLQLFDFGIDLCFNCFFFSTFHSYFLV